MICANELLGTTAWVNGRGERTGRAVAEWTATAPDDGDARGDPGRQSAEQSEAELVGAGEVPAPPLLAHAETSEA